MSSGKISVPERLERTAAALGADAVAALARTRVAVFGLGGVGGWCAEALARSGVGKLMLVDSDRIAESNINRQLVATTKTVGRLKVEVLAERLREINPCLELDLRAARYTAEGAAEFPLCEYDFVIDAIDSLADKAALIRHALSIPGVTLFASMGAAMKRDPLQVRASDFRKVEGDGLARALRARFKKSGGIPVRPFTCVWSPEKRIELPPDSQPAISGFEFPGPADRNSALASAPSPLGSLMPVTATFGLALSSLVINSVPAGSNR